MLTFGGAIHIFVNKNGWRLDPANFVNKSHPSFLSRFWAFGTGNPNEEPHMSLVLLGEMSFPQVLEGQGERIRKNSSKTDMASWMLHVCVQGCIFIFLGGICYMFVFRDVSSFSQKRLRRVLLRKALSSKTAEVMAVFKDCHQRLLKCC